MEYHSIIIMFLESYKLAWIFQETPPPVSICSLSSLGLGDINVNGGRPSEVPGGRGEYYMLRFCFWELAVRENPRQKGSITKKNKSLRKACIVCYYGHIFELEINLVGAFMTEIVEKVDYPGPGDRQIPLFRQTAIYYIHETRCFHSSPPK